MQRAAGRLLLLLGALLAGPAGTAGYGYQRASLTLSPLRHPLEGKGPRVIERELEMNWGPGLDADWVGLFTVPPPPEALRCTITTIGILHSQRCISVEVPIDRVHPDDFPDGYFRTNFSFGHPRYPNGWNKESNEECIPGDACMGYWIAAYKHNHLIDVDCFKIRPTWMGDHRSELENMPLIDVFFPGTHNSDSYNRGLIPTATETVGRYLLTQDTDIWGQLVHGIRYLDLRIGYYPGHKKTASFDFEERYLLSNELINVEALLYVLEEIKEFIMKSKYEVVILDFHDFPKGFENNPHYHYQFVSFLYSLLGDFVVPFNNITYSSTLGDVWNTGRNLIIAYNDVETQKEFPWLWSPISHFWTDKQTTEGLKEFLKECFYAGRMSNRTTFWAAMAKVKPTPIDFMFGGAHSLRQLADKVNRNVTRWFQKYKWDHANIVASDFFLGNNIIDIAVRTNVERANNTML